MDSNDDEKAKLRAADDEESSCHHIGDVDARSATAAAETNNNNNEKKGSASSPSPSKPKSKDAPNSHRYARRFVPTRVLFLLVALLLVAAIALTIGLVARNAKEEDDNASNSNNVAGINEGEAANDDVDAGQLPETVVVDGGSTKVESETFERADEDGNDYFMSSSPSAMPAVHITISTSPSMSPSSSPTTSNPTFSPVTSSPTTSPTLYPVTLAPKLVPTKRPNTAAPVPVVDTTGDDDDFFDIIFDTFDETVVDDEGCFGDDFITGLTCCFVGLWCD